MLTKRGPAGRIKHNSWVGMAGFMRGKAREQVFLHRIAGLSSSSLLYPLDVLRLGLKLMSSCSGHAATATLVTGS